MGGSATRGGGPGDRRAADPWWGDDLVLDDPVDAVVETPALAPAAQARSPRRARRTGGRPRRGDGRGRRERSGIGWLLLGLVVAPIDWFARRVRATPWLRTALVRLAVLCGILAVLACSVGVILINNVVVGRTAELGRLEDQRRELRRDNAVLGAQAAKLEAPDLVHSRATRELGMVQTDTVPPFVYLFDGSGQLTLRQRQRIAAAAERRRRALEAREQSDTGGSAAQRTTTTTGGDDGQ